MRDLDRLIEAVEAGETSWNRLASIAEDAIPPKEAALAATANKGSLDAALALLNALLPGAWVEISGPWRGSFDALVYPAPDYQIKHKGAHPTIPARALLLATLKAHRATITGAAE